MAHDDRTERGPAGEPRRPQAPGDALGGDEIEAPGAHGQVPDGPDPRPSWEQVAERYGDKIYNVAYRLTGNPDDAADLAQDVFVRVYRNLHRYEPGTFDGWVYRITKNLFLDHVRRGSRIRMEPLGEEEWRSPPSTEPGPADVVERRTLEAGLQEGLAALVPEFRFAVVLCDVEGLTYEEIADATGWPIGTVRSRIHRGRRQLREYLEQHRRPGVDAAARRGGPDDG